MPAKQKINPEIWDVWTRTQTAWAAGALDALGPEFKTAANSVMTIEQFADTSHALVKALKELQANQDEYLVAWADDADFVITNQRFMIRRSKAGLHDVFHLSDITKYTEDGWWTKTVSITTRSGRTASYTGLGSVVRPEYMRHAIAAATPRPCEPIHEQEAETATLNTSPRQQNQEEGERQMSDEEMIGSEYPAIQQVIKNRLQPGETLVAFTTATTKIGGSGAAWIPFVGTTLELGRSLTLKPYILAVTDKRFLIIQHNKFSRITKELKEVAFDEVPLERIRTAMSSKRISFVYSMLDGDSLKLELGDGRKFHFRNITAENAAMIRDAILGNQQSQ